MWPFNHHHHHHGHHHHHHHHGHHHHGHHPHFPPPPAVVPVYVPTPSPPMMSVTGSVVRAIDSGIGAMERGLFSHRWSPPGHCTGSYTWEIGACGNTPYGAVHAGRDIDGGPIYAGRAFHNGDLLPAKVTPTHGCAYISWGGQEIKKFEYEVLISHHAIWRFDSYGNVPMEAICFGTTANGEPLYMGRTTHHGSLTPGKVHPSHRVLFIPFDGRELSFHEYEVLCLN